MDKLLGARERLLSRVEAAQYLDVSPITLACWASTRRVLIPMVKVGGLAKYRKADLDAFIASRMVNVEAA